MPIVRSRCHFDARNGILPTQKGKIVGKQKLQLYPFQKKGVHWIHHKFNGRCLVADEMGCGKTVQALFYAWMYLPDDRPIVVVCPANIKENWRREASRHLNMRAEILYKKTPPHGIVRSMKTNTIYIVNYDILGPALTAKKTWNRFLRKLKPQLVIIDEGHYISSPKAKRTKHCQQLIKGIPHVLILSGTPLTNRPAELWTLLNMLRPDKWPSFLRFANRYCQPTYTPFGMVYKGATKLDELHRRLKKWVMIRRRKSEVLKDLPAKQRIIVPVDITDREQYAMAERDFINWLIKTAPLKADKARKAERMVKYGYLLRLTAQLKMKAVQEWIDDFLIESDSKLLVFGVHKLIVRALHENKKYQKISTLIDGGVSQEERIQAIDNFINRGDIPLFFANIQAAGVGWSAKGVETGCMIELPWTPGALIQAEDRIHGIGRGKEGSVSTWYYLIAAGTIEEKLCSVLQDKQQVISQTLDGAVAKEDLNTMDLLETALLNKKKGKGFIRGK